MINRKRLTILVIEDNEADALLIKENLKYSSFIFTLAGNLSDGIQLLSKNVYDAILLDLCLPDSSGINTFEKLYAAAPHIPIIILTGVDDEEIVISSLQIGAQDYLIKGHVNNQILERSIRHAIERKQIEQSLHETLDLNTKIFSAAAIGVLTYKSTGQCVFANEAAAQIVNTTVANLLEQNFHSIESWKKSQLYQVACDVLKTGKPQQQEIYLITSFGKEIWVDFYFATFYLMGEPHLLLILNDKTWKKHIEKTLQWKNYLMDMLMQNIPEAIYFKDLQGRITDISKSLSDKLGFKDISEVIGKTDFDLYSSQHANQAYQDEQNIINSSQGIYNYEEKETYENKPDTWVLTSKMPLFNTEGEIIGTFGVSKDITDRKNAEEALLQSKALLAEAMDIAQLYHWAYDIHEECFIIDKKLYNFLGKKNTPIGMYKLPILEYFEKFVYHEDREIVINDRKKAQNNVAPDYFSQTEYRIVRLDGAIRHILVRTRLELDETAKPKRYYGILQDITERKIALQEAFEVLNKQDSAKTEFLSLISQEIRTPLNGIVGALNLIKHQESSSAIKELVEILNKSVSNLESFTDNAIYNSKFNSNYALKESEFRLNDLIQFAILENENAIAEKNLKIAFEQTNKNITIKADKDLIYKVIINIIQSLINILCINQIFVIEILEDNEIITCSFRSDDNHFPEKLLKEYSSVSGMFQNRDNGLNLYIIKQIMNLHNAEFQFSNQVIGGACIKLLFKK